MVTPVNSPPMSPTMAPLQHDKAPIKRSGTMAFCTKCRLPLTGKFLQNKDGKKIHPECKEASLVRLNNIQRANIFSSVRDVENRLLERRFQLMAFNGIPSVLLVIPARLPWRKYLY